MPTIEEIAQQFGGVKVEAPKGLPQGQDIGQIAKQFGGTQVQPEQPQQGLLKNIAGGIISPFAKTAATIASVGKGIGGVAKGLGQLATGDKQEAFRTFAGAGEGVSFKAPFAGEVKPVSSALEAVGTGVELGSFFIGGSGVSQVGKQTIKGLVFQGAKEGAKFGFLGGALGGGGLALQQEKVTPEDFIKQTAVGGLAGGALGGALGAVAPIGGNVFRKIRKSVKGEPTVPGVTKRGLGRAVERGKEALGKKAELRVQPVNVQKAVNAGIDLPDVQFVNNLSKADKTSASKMIGLLEKNKAGDISARSISEAGNTVLEPVKFIQNLRKSSGKKIGALIKNLPDEPLNIADISTSFVDDLANSGVKVNANGKLNFKNSRLSGARGGPERKQIENMWSFLKPTKAGAVNKKPFQIHLQRQKLFDDLQLAKGQKLFSSNTERILNKVRANLNTPLDSVSPQYTALNRQFAEATGVVDDFFHLIGKSWKGKSDELLSLRAGEVGRRIKGNASAVPLKVLNTVDDIARKNGFKSEKNIVNQFVFNDLLEDIFGTTQTTGLSGAVERGLGKAEFGASVGQQLARGRALGAVAETIGKVSKVFTPTEQEQMRVLRALLGETSERGLGKVGGIVPKKKVIDDFPLLSQAKKFKSAEEFVKAQPKAFHGTTSKLTQFDKGRGAFFTDDFFIADGFASGENVFEGHLVFKKPLVIDAKGRKWDNLKTKFGKSTREVVSNVDENKHDGVIFKNVIDNIFDDADVGSPSTIFFAFEPRESFLNESQLTDIFKQSKQRGL